MPNEVVEPVAGGSAKPVEKESAKKPIRLSPAEFIAQRAKAYEKAPNKAISQAKEPEKKPDPAPEGGKGESKATSEVLSKAKPDKEEPEIDVEGLSDEEKALLQKTRSKLLVRVGELTAKRKAVEEDFARYRASHEQERQATRTEPVRDNPYQSIKDEKELQAKMEEITGTIEWVEARLDDATDLRGEDIAVEVEGRKYTKAQLREYKRNAIKARDTYLPDIRQRFADRKMATQMREGLMQQARRELPWLEQQEDQRSLAVQQTLSDPAFKRIEELDPSVGARLTYIVAHAANSMYGRREIPLEDKLDERQLRRTEAPPENPDGAAGGERGDGQVRQLKDLESRFRQTGKRGDFETLRAAQIARKRNIRL